MKRRAFAGVVVVMMAAVFAAAQGRNSDAPAQEKKAEAAAQRGVPDSPEWRRLTSLVGEWEGVVEEGGQKVISTLEVRMTGGGAAIMHVMGKDTPHEMVTMFHPDGKRLLATHYCAARNHPRMVLVPSKAENQVAFDFLDATNIAPGDGHIKGVVMTFADAEHHDELWTHREGNGKEGTTLFRYTRKKK